MTGWCGLGGIYNVGFRVWGKDSRVVRKCYKDSNEHKWVLRSRSHLNFSGLGVLKLRALDWILKLWDVGADLQVLLGEYLFLQVCKGNRGDHAATWIKMRVSGTRILIHVAAWYIFGYPSPIKQSFGGSGWAMGAYQTQLWEGA